MLTTHELDEVERLADHIVIVDHGRVVGAGTLEHLTGSADSLTFSTVAGIDVASLTRVLGAAVTEATPGRYIVATPSRPRTVAALTAWLAARELTVWDLGSGDRLEDVFFRLTGGDR